MKKLITLPAALFLAMIFSCNKSDTSPFNPVPSKLETESITNAALKNLNVLLFDAIKAADKTGIHQGEHLHLFDVSYLTDGSKDLIEANMAFGLAELKKMLLYTARYPLPSHVRMTARRGAIALMTE